MLAELVELDRTVLGAIAEFKRLNQRYAITTDMFVTFIGKINTYAELGKESFYQSTFKSTDNGDILPLGEILQFPVNKQGLYESICCGALGVTSDELFRIGKYCFGHTHPQVKVDETTVAQLYRMGKIPQMLGLSFIEVELLWKLMSGGEDTLLRIVGGSSSLKTLDIIRETEMILDWMNTYQLDVVSLQAMVTDQYSRTATPELYNFLLKVYQAVSVISREGHQENLPIEKLCQALAADFNIKPNVMEQTLNWLENSNVGFSVQDYWKQLELYFSISHEDELAALEEQPDLVKWCQQVSQYVLIVRWCGLSEQDLVLLSDHPTQLFNEHHIQHAPSLYLLLVLSRLKEWQQRVQVSSDEAMRYFAQVNSQLFTSDHAIKLLANIHGWNEDYTAAMNDYLLGEGEYPKNFEQLFTLEAWVNLGCELKIGSRTLGELADMAIEDTTAESRELITSVANSLMAVVQGETKKKGGNSYV